ncbi:MAG: protein translocase subunit SecF [Desulfuromonadales bacterium]|nr:MAG: protein translocase subunit SecF [Desulfuromonadales bacterium]
MELIGKTDIDFMGKRNISFLISAIVSIIGIIGIIQIARGAANMGIDFSGGTSVQLKFAQAVPPEKAREALAKHHLKEANIQEITEGNKLLVKVGKMSLPQGNAAEVIQDAFRKELPGNQFVVESSTEIGPAVGDKLRKDTLVAVAISLVGIVLYIAWRFDFAFGVGALAATMHDVLAIFAVFFVLNKEVNLLLITAALTIAGYSITDTVVVFDRIRENLHKDAKGALSTIFNRSINEVLSRTIITSLTTFLASAALFFFGGEVIHDFALALLVGVAVGTYSSIFVASPIVVVWGDRVKTSKA